MIRKVGSGSRCVGGWLGLWMAGEVTRSKSAALRYGAMPTTDPFLVRLPTGTMYLVEDQTKRIVRSGLLAAALEQSLGSARDVSDQDIGRWAEGEPVEVLAIAKEPPFVVVGGSRRPIRGLPLPRTVDSADLEKIPEGPQLDVAAANISRTRYQQAVASRGRGRDDVFDRGARVTRGVARKARRELRRIKRKLS
jgi:hypothetical protein